MKQSLQLIFCYVNLQSVFFLSMPIPLPRGPRERAISLFPSNSLISSRLVPVTVNELPQLTCYLALCIMYKDVVFLISKLKCFVNFLCFLHELHLHVLLTSVNRALDNE